MLLLVVFTLLLRGADRRAHGGSNLRAAALQLRLQIAGRRSPVGFGRHAHILGKGTAEIGRIVEAPAVAQLRDAELRQCGVGQVQTAVLNAAALEVFAEGGAAVLEQLLHVAGG